MPGEAPIPIRFGGVPMGVANPPTEAAKAVISINPAANGVAR
jgi:hypothetical protein